MDNKAELKKITNENTINIFYHWLQENPDVVNIQGFNLIRRDNGTISRFGDHIFDRDFIWAERKMLNDWIDARLKVPPPAPDWPALMDTPAFRAYCAATVRADEAEMRAEHED